MPMTVASSRRRRIASRAMWPRSSPRSRAALAAPTLLRRRPIRTFVTRCSDRSRLRPTSARDCAPLRLADIRCSGGLAKRLPSSPSTMGRLATSQSPHTAMPTSLAVWLSAGSQPIFVDAGTYRYHSAESPARLPSRHGGSQHADAVRRRLEPPLGTVQLGHEGCRALHCRGERSDRAGRGRA